MECVLLNADYTFLNVVNWKRAICLVTKGKVQVLKYSGKVIRTVSGSIIKIPAVMKLIKIIRILFRTRVPFTKKNLLIRDGFECAYCGARGEKLTIDHILPKSRGGTTDFDNCITSCKRCNLKKGAKTPVEANMFPKKKAYQPTISEFLRLRSKTLGIEELIREVIYGE